MLPELAPLNVNTKRDALIMSGKTLIPLDVIATTNGDAAERFSISKTQPIREGYETGRSPHRHLSSSRLHQVAHCCRKARTCQEQRC